MSEERLPVREPGGRARTQSLADDDRFLVKITNGTTPIPTVEDAVSASFQESVYQPMPQKQVKMLVDIELRGSSPMQQRWVG
ncbi:hypothetical protein [Paraburkholderia sp. RL17-337-BIB-A]|jgi:hypothetical protein|uniref:hypothetical protein n=1 Tax=Paraburkholderia sp. RL17-337-BIB-A TaxID=3031636 RepID=UPI0038B7F258